MNDLQGPADAENNYESNLLQNLCTFNVLNSKLPQIKFNFDFDFPQVHVPVKVTRAECRD